MPLQAGTRVDAYELLGPLGAGGMGEVYKARDTRLGRLVALKVLPGQLTADREACDRLEREARTLASISHPHVCSLYELTEHEQQSVLVMEYLQGTSLAQRLTEGRLKISECVRLGIEIADGLAAAHRAGIVHRDLKPENIMLTKSGAKLLDFGLAKLQMAAVHGSIAETVTRNQLTGVGIIAGTLPYMAPEQLEGREVDARTDIWGFGCVLYEMVTGRRTFGGATPASLIGMILDRDPPPPSTVEPTAGGALDRVIQKCLAKDPEARWQTAQDLRDELKWIGSGVAAVPAGGVHAALRWRHVVTGAAIGATLASGALLVLQPWRSPPSEPTVSRLELTIPRLGSPDSLAVSPDGRQLAFIAPDPQGRQVLWVRSLAETTPRPLPGSEGAHAPTPPFWSPDGRWLAFVSGNKLKKIDVTAGGAVTLADVTGEVMGGDWGVDGTLIVGTQQASSTHGVHRTSAEGGPLVPLVPLESGAFLHGLPRFPPDGRRFLYLSWAFDEDRREICLASLDDAIGRCLGVKSHYLGGFTSDGYLAYARGDTLFAQPFDLSAGRVTGEPVVIAEQLSHDPFGRTSIAAAATTLVYQTAPPQIRQFIWISRDGRKRSMTGEAGAYGGFDVTARGEYILTERTEPGGTGLWLMDVTRGITTRAVSLGPVAGQDRLLGPVFARDGQRFVFYRTRRSGRSVVVELPTRGGDERLVYEYPRDGIVYLADVSDDGGWLAVGIAEPGRRYAAVVPRTGGDPVVFAEGSLDLASARLSHDARSVAYVSHASGQAQVYVSPLPPTGERWQVSTAGGVQPAWRGDGRELFYMAPDGSVMAVPIATGTTIDAGVPTRLFTTTGLAARFRVPGYRVTADGQRFLLNTPREGDQTATTTTLQVVLNWTAALKR